MGFLNSTTYDKKKNEKVNISGCKDYSDNKEFIACVLKHMCCGTDILRQANSLVVSINGKNYLIKKKIKLNSEKYHIVSDNDFEGEWSRLGQLQILNQLDLIGLNVLYDLPNKTIERVNSSYNIREL